MHNIADSYARATDNGTVKEFERRSNEYKTKREESFRTDDNNKEYKVIISPSRSSFFLDMGSGVTVFQGECMRASFLDKKGFPISNMANPLSIRKMIYGQEFERVEHTFEKAGGILEKHNFRMNKEISPDVLLSCEVDSICRLDDGKLYIIEIKSYDGYWARKHVCGNKSQEGMPKYDHIVQNMWYLAIAEEYLPAEEFGRATVFHYRARSDMDAMYHTLSLEKSHDSEGKMIDAFPVVNGKQRGFVSLREMVSRGLQLASFIIEDKLPPREPEYSYSEEKVRYLLGIGEVAKSRYKDWQEKGANIGDWQCGYCKFKALCLGDNPKGSLPEDNAIMSHIDKHVVDTAVDTDSGMWT